MERTIVLTFIFTFILWVLYFGITQILEWGQIAEKERREDEARRYTSYLLQSESYLLDKFESGTEITEYTYLNEANKKSPLMEIYDIIKGSSITDVKYLPRFKGAFFANNGIFFTYFVRPGIQLSSRKGKDYQVAANRLFYCIKKVLSTMSSCEDNILIFEILNDIEKKKKKK